MFIPKRTTFFICVEDCIAWLEALLITAACGDVVKRVKSVYVQMSLIWSGGHPLYQAVSLFSVLKKRTRERYKEKEAEQKKRKLNKKDFKKGGKALFRNKIDKIKLDKSKNKFWEVHKNGFLVLISSCFTSSWLISSCFFLLVSELFSCCLLFFHVFKNSFVSVTFFFGFLFLLFTFSSCHHFLLSVSSSSFFLIFFFWTLSWFLFPPYFSMCYLD